MSEKLLELKNLTINIPTQEDENFLPVDSVCFAVNTGEIMALVGESGSGKTLTAMAVGGVIPASAKCRGEILFEKRDMLALSTTKLGDIRGRDIFYVFQNPGNVFNPCVVLAKQLYLLCRKAVKDKREFADKFCDCLSHIGFDDPQRILGCYPFQLSGGMLQRLMIACALLVRPKLLIADEPTTALDVGVQKEILHALAFLRDQTGMSILLITHDFGVVSEIADRVVVMQKGKVVETADVNDIFDKPQQKYTIRLLAAAQNREMTEYANPIGNKEFEQVI